MIVGVGSWRGTGATTTALLLAATFALDGPAWLVEADPAGGVLAARIDLPRQAAGALERIAFPTTRTAATETRFIDQAAHRGSLRIITGPGDPFRAWACHTPRFAWAPMLRELDGPVVVDLGRLRGGSPVGAVIAQLDTLLLTVTPDPVSLVASQSWLDGLGRVSPADPGLVHDVGGLVVVDAPTGADRVGQVRARADLGERLVGWLPWAPAAVDAVQRGVDLADRRLRRQPLVHALDELTAGLRSATEVLA